jgi:transposase
MTGKFVTQRRKWRHLDILRKRVYLVAETREGYCKRHGRLVERVPWASPNARHTRAFDRQVASLVQVADKSAAERMFGVSWRTVARIVERVVEELLPKNRFKGLEYIGVDETSYKRGHRYITVVTNLVTGGVVWMGEGKSAETLGQFFADLGPKQSKRLKLVAMDMSEAYLNAVADHAPQADIVYDRFHVVKLLLDAIDEVRRIEVNKLTGDQRKALKGTRFSLLRNPKRHLSPKDVAAIEHIMATNRRLARAYELRCEFEELWELKDEEKAREFLMNWTRSALLSRREPLRRFANTVRKHMEGILGFFRWWGTTSGLVEGINNKIKLAIHRAYGFHSVDALMAMVYLCCSGLKIAL